MNMEIHELPLMRKEETKVLKLFGLAVKLFRKDPRIVLPYMVSTGFSSINSMIITLTLVLALNKLVSGASLKPLLQLSLGSPLKLVGEILKIVFSYPETWIALLLYLVTSIVGNGLSMTLGFSMAGEAVKTGKTNLATSLKRARERLKEGILASLLYQFPLIIFLIGVAVNLPILLDSFSKFTFESFLFASITFILFAAFMFIVYFAMSFLFIYLYPVVALENQGVINSLKRSVSIALQNFDVTLKYSLLVLLIDVALLVAQFFTGFLIFGGLISAFSTFIVNPLYMLTKTFIYNKINGLETIEFFEQEKNWFQWIAGGFKNGLRKFKEYTWKNSFLLPLFFLALVLSYLPGYQLGEMSFHVIKNLTVPPEKMVFKPQQLLFLGNARLISIIWFQNLQVGIGLVFSSFLPFIPQFLIVMLNGYIIGLILGFAEALTGKQLLISMAPHGVIEIPVFLVMASCGFLLSKEVVRVMLKRSSFDELAYLMDDFLKAVIGALILYGVAAFIEVIITPFAISTVLTYK